MAEPRIDLTASSGTSPIDYYYWGEPRPKERVERMLNAIQELWQRFPDWRLGQLLVNVSQRFEANPYYVEDSLLEEALEQFKR